MPNCEMCGSEKELVNAVVEGTILSVCKNCSSYGDVISISKSVEVIKQPRRYIEVEESSEDIVEDYGTIVKISREKLELTQDDLAKKINEKSSILHKVESNQLRPNISLARKLEKFLDIVLIEKSQISNKINVSLQDANLTIGDLIKFKKK